MLVNAFQSGRFDSPLDWLAGTLMLLPGIVIGITFHEFAHAFAAYKLGDQTPKAQGRVTLNPLAHIDPIGIITLIVVGFGWGKPVQVNPFAFRKNRRASSFIVDIAGVATNFIIAFVCGALIFIVPNYVVGSILSNIAYINIVLMLFNLLPVPPLDGFGIITEIFDLRRFSWHRKLYEFGSFILLALIIFGATRRILGPPINAVYTFIENFWWQIFI
jgi:Zn-dependent protease